MIKSKGERIFNILNIVFMLLMCVIMLYPYLNQLAISLNDGSDTMLGGITIFPRKFTWVNYRTIIQNADILNSLVITLMTVVMCTVVTLAVTTSAAYSISKKTLPLRNFFIWYLLIPSYINAGIIPTFILFRYLKLLNNIWVYVLPGAFTFYNLIIIRTFISGLPGALEEAALIDGANEVQILYKVILPLCMPVLATVALWTMVGAWNNWTTTLYYVNEKELYTLQYVIMQIIKQSEVVQKMAADAALIGGGSQTVNAKPTSESVKAAAIIFSTIPIIMVYPFLQKYFVKGVTLGAVKD